jgi:hypothetical protein
MMTDSPNISQYIENIIEKLYFVIEKDLDQYFKCIFDLNETFVEIDKYIVLLNQELQSLDLIILENIISL